MLIPQPGYPLRCNINTRPGQIKRQELNVEKKAAYNYMLLRVDKVNGLVVH